MKASLFILLAKASTVGITLATANAAIPSDLGKMIADIGIIGLLFYLYSQERKERKELFHHILKQNENTSKNSN